MGLSAVSSTGANPRQSSLGVATSAASFGACVGSKVGDESPATPDSGPTTTDRDGATATDSATGTDADAPVDAGTDAPPAYDVRSLAGLRLWLESTKSLATEAAGSTGFGSWADGSGRWDGGTAGAPDGGGHLAVPHMVNPPSIVPNAFGARPTVSFISGNGYIRLDNHDDWAFGLGDFLIVEVAKVTSGAGPLWRLSPQATAGTQEAFSPGQLCVVFGIGVTNGCTMPVYTPSTEPHVFAARRKSDLFTLRVDGSVRGTLDRTGDPPDIFISPFGQPFVFIGNSVTMQVSEVIVIVGPTPDADLATLEGHLKAKYLIP